MPGQSPVVQRLVVGLGNPGPRYEGTRHNVGFEVVRALADRLDVSIDESRFDGRFGSARLGETGVGLLLPETFMNRSGQSVAAAVDALELGGAQLLVVFDDLDLPFGRLRLRARGGPGGHNGLADILDVQGGADVPRLRFGVGRPPSGVDPVEYVLSPFAPEERDQLPDRVDAAVDAVVLALEAGVTEAMNRVNRVRPEEPDADAGGERNRRRDGDAGREFDPHRNREPS